MRLLIFDTDAGSHTPVNGGGGCRDHTFIVPLDAAVVLRRD